MFNVEKINSSICKSIRVTCDLQSNSPLKLRDVPHKDFLAKSQMNWERQLGVQASLEETAISLKVLTGEEKSSVEIINVALVGERAQRKWK